MKRMDVLGRLSSFLPLLIVGKPRYHAFLTEDAARRITAYPELNFLIIVNPNSGPGDSPSPDANYAREVPKLNAHANVCTVGYIRIHYCNKPLSDVYKEVDTYAGWAKDYEKTGLGVRGILVDETPNHYSSERAEYLDALHQHIKSTPGILDDRLVVHNPGTPPDAELANPGPDIILVCEEPYGRYRSDEVQQRLCELPYDRARSGYMLSEVPVDELGPLVSELRHRGGYLFVTEVSGDFYERFGPTSWDVFMKAMQST